MDMPFAPLAAFSLTTVFPQGFQGQGEKGKGEGRKGEIIHGAYPHPFPLPDPSLHPNT